MSSPESAQAAFTDLLSFSKPLEQLLAAVEKFPESDVPLVTLQAMHISAVLSRYVKGQISAEGVEEWANFVQMSKEIAVPTTPTTAVQEILHRLANPTVALFELTPDSAGQMIERLNAAA